jgi:hypothetical protein
MTRNTNARLAGFTFLVYIAAGITSMVLFGRATGGEGIAAKLASAARHTTDLRAVVILTVLTSLSAWVLGVTLYAITREQDPDLAILAMICRVGEGLIGAASVESLGLLWLATATGASAPDTQAAHALGAFLLRGESLNIGAMFFAVGSTLFSWLLLRGRMIPIPLAWLGVIASVLVVVGLPLGFVGLVTGPAAWFLWLPMLVFEVSLALLWLIKGVAAPATR